MPDPLFQAVFADDVGSGTANTLDIAITVPAGLANGAAFLDVVVSTNSGATIQSIAGGGTWQRISQIVDGANERLETWFLPSPPAGTYNVTITLAGGATTRIVGIVDVWAHVDQDTPYAATPLTVASASAASLTLDITTNENIIRVSGGKRDSAHLLESLPDQTNLDHQRTTNGTSTNNREVRTDVLVIPSNDPDDDGPGSTFTVGFTADVAASMVLSVFAIAGADETGGGTLVTGANRLPYGVVNLPPGKRGPSGLTLIDPAIHGHDLRWRWKDMEPSEGVYVFDTLIEQVERIQAAGQFVILRAMMNSAPDWAKVGVPTFSYLKSGNTRTVPVPYNTLLVDRKCRFHAAFGAALSRYPAVRGISCQFANVSSDDWVIPHTADDIVNWLSNADPYTSQKLINAGQRIIQAVADAWPQVPMIFLSVAQNGDLDPSPGFVADNVISWAMGTRWCEKFSIMRNSMAATVQNAGVLTADNPNQVIKYWSGRHRLIGFQMLWYVTGDASYRMNGGNPLDPGECLRRSITKGLSYMTGDDGIFLEIYQVDLLNGAIRSSWADTIPTFRRVPRCRGVHGAAPTTSISRFGHTIGQGNFAPNVSVMR